MTADNDRIKADMIAGINSGGAWFRTRENNYLKIGRSDTDDCLYAMACAVGPENVINAGAYSFGTDWFDISFHGSLIDIYVDPDTLQRRDIIYTDSEVSAAEDSAENAERHSADLHRHEPVLQLRDADGRLENASRLAQFCKHADKEIREMIDNGTDLRAFRIDGAGFAHELDPSEAKMGRRKSIFSLVDTTKLKNGVVQ